MSWAERERNKSEKVEEKSPILTKYLSGEILEYLGDLSCDLCVEWIPMEANKVFGQGKGQEADKLNIDSIIARLLEGKNDEIGLNRKLIDLNSISNSLQDFQASISNLRT